MAGALDRARQRAAQAKEEEALGAQTFPARIGEREGGRMSGGGG